MSPLILVRERGGYAIHLGHLGSLSEGGMAVKSLSGDHSPEGLNRSDKECPIALRKDPCTILVLTFAC